MERLRKAGRHDALDTLVPTLTCENERPLAAIRLLGERECGVCKVGLCCLP